jgi:hypothetical protein
MKLSNDVAFAFHIKLARHMMDEKIKTGRLPKHV